MDREGAETYLRLLAEAALRGSLTPAAAQAPNASTIMVVGHALTAVEALDPVTAEEILADFRLAVTVRHLHSEAGQGPGQAEFLLRLVPPIAVTPREIEVLVGVGSAAVRAVMPVRPAPAMADT